MNPFLKRWSPYVIKLAMLFRIIEDPTSDEISDTALAASMSVIEPAIKSTAILFEKDLGESEAQRKCRKIKDYIAKHGGTVSRQILIKSKTLDGSYKEYDEILKTLIEGGEVIENTSGAKIYALNTKNAE